MSGSAAKNSLFPAGQPSHYKFFLCYLATLAAFGSFVNDLYLPTLPQMRIDFHASISLVQMGLSVVMAGLGLGELFWGPLSDKIGRKPVLAASLGLFIISSAISIFSPTIYFFLACRFFQGLGASGAILLSRTIPADEAQGLRLAKIMVIVGAINGVAPAMGPILGGLLADSIGWRGIFIVLTAIGIIMLLAGIRLKETLPPDRREKGSLLHSLLSYSALCKNRPFMIHVMLKGSALGVLFSYISSGPFIIQTHYGFTAFEFGCIFGMNACFVILGSVVCLRFPTMKKAAVTGAAGMVVFALVEAIVIYYFDSVWIFESLIIPMLFFSGLVFASSNTLAMTEGHVEAGSASAILGLGGYVFGSIVSPLVGLGNILASTSIALVSCSLICLFYAWQSFKLPPLKIQS